MNSENEIVNLHLDDIIPNRFQPREVFDEKALKELAVSIKEHGVIHPIIVRKINGKYEIIAGERRYKASALAGLTKIPAIVRDLDDKESSKIALLENLQRRNLNPVEEARTYQKILEIDEMTQEELAKTMGKSQSAVANKLRLLALSDEVQKALLKEQISERHARALLTISNPDEQKEMLKKVIDNKMTVRQLEKEIKGTSEPETDDSSEDDNEQKVKNSDEIEISRNNFEKNKFFGKEPDKEDKDDTIPSFINYGEIKDDEEKENDSFGFGFNPSTAPININDLKSNARDIETNSIPQNENNAMLDNLLNISPPKENEFTPKDGKFTPKNIENLELKSQEEPEEKNKFFSFPTPQEEPKQEEKTESKKKPDDYFKQPSLIDFSMPKPNNDTKEEVANNSDDEEKALDNILNNNSDKIASSSNNEKIEIEDNNIDSAISLLKEDISKIKSKGINVEIDEMHFENSYQIIIKLEKNNK